MMAFLGPVQMIVLMVVLLLVFGPDKLPEMGKQVGKAMRELMKAKQEFMNSMNFDDDEEHHKPYQPPTYDENYYNSYNSSSYNGSNYDGSDYTETSKPAAIEPPRTDFVAAAFTDTDEFGTAPAPSSPATPKTEATKTESESKTFNTPSGTIPREK